MVRFNTGYHPIFFSLERIHSPLSPSSAVASLQTLSTSKIHILSHNFSSEIRPLWLSSHRRPPPSSPFTATFLPYSRHRLSLSRSNRKISSSCVLGLRKNRRRSLNVAAASNPVFVSVSSKIFSSLRRSSSVSLFAVRCSSLRNPDIQRIRVPVTYRGDGEGFACPRPHEDPLPSLLGSRMIKWEFEVSRFGVLCLSATSVLSAHLVSVASSILSLAAGMPEGKLLVGLSWQPQLLIPSSSKAADACHNKPQSEASNSSLWKPNTELVDGLFIPPNDPRKLNKLLRKQAKDTAGKDWFDMPAQTITPELQTDLKLLKLRSALDPKRHYKKGESKSKALPKYFQVGTVVEDASEFYSERLTKKERKATIADELLSDQKLAAYRKRKVREIEEQNRPVGNTKWKIRGRNSWKRAKERRVY
nr:uncharacterized protein LOC112743395 isoform X1 [Arachis hypogaea]